MYEIKKKVLIIEDEESISDIIKFNLTNENYLVETANNGREGLEKVYSFKPDLILLDIMIPEINGLDVCKKVRVDLDTPIIMLTAKADEFDKVLGLELGADDYVTKPFSMRELIARVKTNIRKKGIESNLINAQKRSKTVKRIGRLLLDTQNFELKKDNKTIDLSLREFYLIKFLAENPKKIFSRESLLSSVWGKDYVGDVRTVDVTIRRIREKIEDNPSDPKYIMTKRGVGYYFRRLPNEQRKKDL